MTSEVYRWQAAMGAVAGAVVADAIEHNAHEWTSNTCAAVTHAEGLLRGDPVPLDLSAREAVPSAIHLAVGPAPLLVDQTTAALVDAVRHALEHAVLPEFNDPVLARALDIANHAKGFEAAVRHAMATADTNPEVVVLTGALVGLIGGIGAVPARLVSALRVPHGRPGRRQLCSLTNRLLGIERPLWYDPRNRRGPREVLPGLWLSNLLGVRSFVENHCDGLVLSLCDDEGRAGDHPHHITFHLEDTPRTDANPSLELVVDDVLAEIAAARAAGQPVLLHCRHGASRTGLVLRLLLADEIGLSADDALTEAECLWPHTSRWNGDWTRLVEARAAPGNGRVTM